MPLPEFHPESSQSKMPNYASDLPFMHDEFVELLWDNGPIVMQGQSNRPRKSSFYSAFSPHNSKDREKDKKETTYPKIGHFTAMEPKMNNFPSSGHSVDVEVNAEDDDIVPWINFPIEDPLPNPIHNDDYCSEFLNEFSGANPNSLNSQSNAVPAMTRSACFGQAVRDSHIEAERNVSGPARIKTTSQQFQLQSSIPSTKSRVSDTSIGNHSKAHKDSGGMAVMNFTHFSRPVALARADLQGANKLESNKMAKTGMTSNPMESTVVESSSGLKSVLETRGQESSPVTPKGELRLFSRPHQEAVFVEESKAVQRDEASVKNNKHDTNDNCNRSPERIASVAVGRHEAEKGHEAVVASSVCSGSSPGGTSNDLKHTEKRKRCEGEESGYQSEDIEDDSVGLRKPTTLRAASTKRSRAAEVHNLSERRRRDRINEKMRALQELIPNCNKTDKASMLDEAIEYLKTLQMQVQIMSMGSGMCMPSMMMQHIRGPTMPHFSPMGVGMGMGMGLGYGLGMYDMNGSPRCPLIPVPPVHGPQFSCHPMSGTPGYHHVPGSPGVQVFGIPGQGFPVSMPHRPPSGSFLGLSTKVTSVSDMSGMTTSPAPVSNTKDQHQESANLETQRQPDDSQAAEKCFQDSALVQTNENQNN